MASPADIYLRVSVIIPPEDFGSLPIEQDPRADGRRFETRVEKVNKASSRCARLKLMVVLY